MATFPSAVKVLEQKKVPEIAIQGSGDVYIPKGIKPEEWLKVREKTILAGQLFRDNQFFLALNVLNEVDPKYYEYDPQLTTLILWCYINLGVYTKAQAFAEKMIHFDDNSIMRRGLLMSLHMQGKYSEALAYVRTFDDTTKTEISKLIDEITAANANRLFPPYICAIGGHVGLLQQYIRENGNPNEIFQSPRLGPGHPSILYLAAANGQDEIVNLLLNLNDTPLPDLVSLDITPSPASSSPTTADDKDSGDDDATTSADTLPDPTVGDGQEGGDHSPLTKESEKQVVLIDMDNLGWTPLHIASYLGFDNVVRLLLKYGANIHARLLGNSSDPLQLAVIGNNLSTIQLLLDSGADINTSMPEVPNLGIVENFLIVPGTTTIRVGALRGPAYWHAAAKFRWPIIELLVKRGLVDVNIKNRQCSYATFLHFACGRGMIGDTSSLPFVKCLLRLNADPDPLTEGGYSPLHFICRSMDDDSKEIIKILLDHKVNVNAMTRHNETPLTCALSAANEHAICTLLAQEDLDIYLSELQLKQPLFVWCVLSGGSHLLQGMINTLKQKDKMYYDKHPDHLLQHQELRTKAAEMERARYEELFDIKDPKQQVAEIKRRAMAPPERPSYRFSLADHINNKTNRIGMTALHWACLKGDWVNVALLVKNGADVEAQCAFNNINVTPLKCSQMYRVGSKLGAGIEDMQDCMVIIQTALADKYGVAAPDPIYAEVLYDDIGEGEEGDYYDYEGEGFYGDDDPVELEYE